MTDTKPVHNPVDQLAKELHIPPPPPEPWLYRTFGKFLLPALYLSLAIITFGLFLFGYWAFWPVKTFTPNRVPLEILNPGNKVAQGSYVIFRGGGFHHTDGVQVDVYAEVQDGFLLQYPSVGYVTQYGQRPAFASAKYPIPCFVPPGRYKLVITSVFHVNPIRNETLTVSTEPFWIQASDPCVSEAVPPESGGDGGALMSTPQETRLARARASGPLLPLYGDK